MIKNLKPLPRPVYGRRRNRWSMMLAALLIVAALIATFQVAFAGNQAHPVPAPSIPAQRSQVDSAGTPTATTTQASDADHVLVGGFELLNHPVSTPGEGGLNPELANRFAAARSAARADGIKLVINSGWRSSERQQYLLDQAILEHGSLAAAKQYVAPIGKSSHELGLAIDVGPIAGASWMQAHGRQFGLCQVYDNEPWHYEPLIAPGGTCPPRHADASWLWE